VGGLVGAGLMVGDRVLPSNGDAVGGVVGGEVFGTMTPFLQSA